MVRSTMYILAALVAIVFGFVHTDQPASMAAPGPDISVRLTTVETDCIVGGEAGCVEVGVAAFDECINNVNTAGEFDGVGDLIECGTVGVYSGVACAVSWFFSLFF